MDYPFLRVETYNLRAGSGGAGKRRGGLGFERSYRILADGVQFATYGDRFKTPAEGLFGGGDGAHAEIIVEGPDGAIRLKSKTVRTLKTGELLRVRTGGGGGYGLAAERPGDLSKHDQAQGLS